MLSNHIKKEVEQMAEKNFSMNWPVISRLNEKLLNHVFWFYFLFYLYTSLALVLLMLEFFTKAKLATLPGGLMTLYLAFLAGFTGQGEAARWRLNYNAGRFWGEFWAYIWLLSGLVVFGFNGFYPGFKVPGNLYYIVYTVLVSFVSSTYSRKAYSATHPPEKMT